MLLEYAALYEGGEGSRGALQGIVAHGLEVFHAVDLFNYTGALLEFMESIVNT